MNANAAATRKSLAARRNALVEECELQRRSLAAAAADALQPLDRRHLRATVAARLKVPLMVAAATLGLAALRPKRILPLLTAGGALWKSVSAALPLVQNIAARLGHQRLM